MCIRDKNNTINLTGDAAIRADEAQKVYTTASGSADKVLGNIAKMRTVNNPGTSVGVGASFALNLLLSLIHISEGDFKAALNYADQCLAMDELLDDALRADIYLKQGYALMYSQRFEEALAALDTCLTLLPGAADAMLLKLQTLSLIHIWA